MSHAEIWDDSALIDSWNDALTEYKLYHGIQASREKVEDVLQSHEGYGVSSGPISVKEQSAHSEQVEMPNGLSTDIQEEEKADAVSPHVFQPKNKLSQAEQALGLKPGEAGSQRSSQPPLQHLIGSVHDECLKNLLMSWYYAGYYTGLYEGQQQGR